MCEQHSPVPSQAVSDKVMRATINAIKECEQEKITALGKLMSTLKPVQVTKIKTGKKRKGPHHDSCQTLEENGKEKRASISRKEMSIAIEPTPKRKRGRPRKDNSDQAK